MIISIKWIVDLVQTTVMLSFDVICVLQRARFKKGSDFHTCCDYRCFCVFAVSKAFLVYFNLN